ncbi:2-oxoglutarate dehydrogenase complex dihydrolipoyllysine-residue succinyltransferase [Bacteriovorax stolpii]|uniref:Dihydrolipoyllysine-residue succinyltransferase component of 2-oxoglutarate dehydrogenase complex n=1 Tax=Bacteriovorax stolpii TaxID=960 RepID=A0A2K9NTI2_BACTC|nr:2-oxoglutarate dehydrogenase complex dihydrolipoyllysine-residue succinyltransferase [Bacteriovorax stolpii]AUN98836.1 dihydrolipoyllysine-residue succinyltransferase [Bacteriovorax stolpii]QDK41169.1 2-oxoglutarate dehydrogenase complex dihydrolipoyllysine-residue succinyltransferase [Bacteriovorax stolpii]TDP55645.1 2-oxoglutarate dehydrogenase E2 component [Bacteriovorax stolpii]
MSVELKIPVIGESVTEVTLSSWLKKDGDYVAEGEAVCEIESDKASMELPAPSAGVLKIMAEAGSELKIGAKIGELDTSAAKPAAGAAKAEAPKAEAAPAPAQAAVSSGKEVNVPSPAARKILDEKGVNSTDVKGSGKDGRITKEDAMNAQASAPKAEAKPAAAAAPRAAAAPGSRGVRPEKMTRLRKTIAAKLVEAKNTTAMLTTFNEVDMSALMELRKKYKEQFTKKHGVGLGFMSLFTKAVTVALKDWPAVNAQINGDEIIFHDYADVGIAVSTPKGLVVPVVRNAESLSLAEIEKEILALATKARDGKITIEEMQGGTFSITNGGVFGSMLSTPILNIPQSAILGMHNIIERPVAVNGQVVIRPMMYLALSYDHRIIDGRESVSFLKQVKELLEDPSRLLLDV